VTAAARIKETTIAQRRAADPRISAFVSANAGSGKTRVLTNRVARLLLEGADPSTVLCITFTKTAAAEMADRLFKLLGRWALAGESELQAALADLDGDPRRRSGDELARARRLFARALETPGGLKIQTIHSFCESVLKRFPIEAGVPPGFTVIDELEAGDLRRAAVARVAARDDPETGDDFSQLLGVVAGDRLRTLLEDAVMKRRRFARAEAIGWTALGREVASALGEPGEPNDALSDIVAAINAFDLQRLSDLMRAGSQTTRDAAIMIDAFRDGNGTAARFAAVNQVFLTAAFQARADVISRKTAKAEPEFAAAIKQLQNEILSGLDRFNAATAVLETRVYFMLVARCLDAYATAKAEHAALDFDDLIDATRRLLAAQGGASWVLYKLDMGLAHILLDEAQDTGPEAWDVIEAPLQEFFAGAGAKERIRTFFAVGDQKQSIYSFQGADAALFHEKEENLGKTIAAARRYENVPLKASFRTAAPVLDFVDALFARGEVVENVSADTPLKHHCTRDGAAGLVEIWPLVPMPEKQEVTPWEAPLDAKPAQSRARLLADEVARTIKGWLDGGEILEAQGRPIEAGDILILVQSRGALFSEMIRALGALRVPVAGADKIRLMEDQGVLDLVSYARAALFEGDDLSLAETLKGPFFGVSEESLYDLAAQRGEQTLWEALAARRSEREDWRPAFEEIARAREVALGKGAVAFLTHALETGSRSGWQRLQSRLGAPCREPICEFLRQAHEFELKNPRSLRLFLAAMAKSDAEVSRESSEHGPTVRVMTAHKAKGLEAEIVFLLDAHRRPPLKNIGDLLTLEGPHGDALPVLALGDAREAELLVAARERAKRLMRDEYRRLLYVGATRAKDRLYICGHALGNEKDPHAKAPAEKSWYALAEDAFAALGARVEDGGEKFGGRIKRLSSPQTVPPNREAPPPRPAVLPSPDDLKRAAPPEKRARRLSPSELGEATAAPAYSPARGVGPYRRGRILHLLLELLPETPPGAWRAAADRLLARRAADRSGAERAELREEAFRVLDNPQFAAVFAPGSLAEVPIGGRPFKERPDLLVSGQIDRLVATERRVLIVDYKTNRPPPKRVEETPAAYLAQMAAYRALLQEIYPGRKIEAALLWTFDARLMALPDAALDRALKLTLA
jgi:ATP-dependent helicase/nuclease subunit A